MRVEYLHLGKRAVKPLQGVVGIEAGPKGAGAIRLLPQCQAPIRPYWCCGGG